MEERICTAFGIESLKDQQKDALRSILERHDTVVSLPTGSGKSLCFEAITTALDSNDAIVLVVSPLAFLLRAEQEKLNRLGIESVYIGDKSTWTLPDLQSGRYRYVLGNPEQFLADSDIAGVLRNAHFKRNVHTIVFDEVHTAVAWGLSNDGKEAFRSYFSRVGDLRALFPEAAMLCLSATVSNTTLGKIKGLFALRDPKIISESPDRMNIRMAVQKIKDVTCFDWLIESLKSQSCPRTIIYCRRFKDCSHLFNYFSSKLGRVVTLHDRIFDMVHSKTPEDVKNHVSSELMKAESKLRVVIATKVLGMGLDVKCDQVVQYGPPSTVDDYIQQIGRAGRSNTQAHSILLYHGRQLRNTDASILALVKSDKCYRSLALADYTSDPARNFPMQHLCCSVCAESCECGSCESAQNGYERFQKSEMHGNVEIVHDEIPMRSVEEDQRQYILNELYNLKVKLDRNIVAAVSAYTDPAITHGLTEEIIQSVIDELANIFCVDDLIEGCSLTNYDTACEVILLLSGVFSDMDSDFTLDEDTML